MNDIIVQSIFSEIVCLELIVLVFKTIVLNEVNHSYKLANEIIEALKGTDFNIVEIPQDQNFKSATIVRKTIQQQGAKPSTLAAFKKLAELLK